ncbi:MAG TPA: WYL domain-containing protein [Cyclobacteriaceae bacterium]|nr:WYL domain-containing protein [Cyclobacteriaceae bacterium]
MPVRKKAKRSGSIIPQTKLLRLFQIISVLKTGRWTIRSLAQRFDTSERTIYRYINLLEEVELLIEKDFDGKYFIHSSEDELGAAEFTIEEMKLIKKLIQTEVDNNPLKALLLKKLSLNSELDKVPNLIVHARRGKLVEQIAQAMKDKKQLVLHSYHSANSSEITDRLVEPIAFGDNYQTVIALDTKDKQTKQFKIDRIGEIADVGKTFEYEQLHQKTTTDIFGMTGGKSTWVTLDLRMRSYLLLREEHPLSIPYIEKKEEGYYQFHGPVNNFDGIGRFVLGLVDETNIVGPADFKKYLKDKIAQSKIGS